MHKQTLKIGTFNACNLSLPNIEYYKGRSYSPTQFKTKINWLSDQLTRMNVDIVGFQEIFHEQALQQVLRKNEKLKYANHVIAHHSSKRRPKPCVALASTKPILYHEVIQNFPTKLDIDDLTIPIHKFSRPVLKAGIELKKGLIVTVFVAHLKSKRPMFKEGEDRDNPINIAKAEARSLVRRTVEAMALRALIVEEAKNNNRPCIVLGDLNDSLLAVSTRIILGNQPSYKPFEEKLKVWDTLLYHVKDIQARRSLRKFYYTHIYNGHHESLDHIMVSQEFVAQNPKRIGKVKYVATFTDHLIDETLSHEHTSFL